MTLLKIMCPYCDAWFDHPSQVDLHVLQSHSTSELHDGRDNRFYRVPGEPVVALVDVLDLLEKRAQIEAPNAAAALRWAATLATRKWGIPECVEPPQPHNERPEK